MINQSVSGNENDQTSISISWGIKANPWNSSSHHKKYVAALQKRDRQTAQGHLGPSLCPDPSSIHQALKSPEACMKHMQPSCYEWHRVIMVFTGEIIAFVFQHILVHFSKDALLGEPHWIYPMCHHAHLVPASVFEEAWEQKNCSCLGRVILKRLRQHAATDREKNIAWNGCKLMFNM